MPPGRTVVTDDGCALWLDDVGQGEPLVMCHGGPGLWDMFADVAAALAPSVRVVRWDQRGCGRSDRRGPYTVAQGVADLEAVRRHLGLDRVAVLGHSWGAELALHHALAHPDRVSKLVYVSGTGLGEDWRAEYARNLAERLGDDHARWVELQERTRTGAEERELAVLQWSADFADADRAVGYAERMASPWFDINYACNTATGADAARLRRETDLPAACRGLGVPTLIVDGAQDIRPRWAVDSLAYALPDATRVVFQDAGHVPWLEVPEEFDAVVLRHVRGH